MLHEFHAFKPNVIASKIDFGLSSKTGILYSIVLTTDLQLVRVTLVDFKGSCAGIWGIYFIILHIFL